MRRIIAALLIAAALGTATLLPTAASAEVSVGVSVAIGPPPLPYYPQPIAPGPGYIWTPGYWSYGPDGYFWVPGTWVLAPEVGLLWTPGYWGWNAGYFVWHRGYWGPHVGFYGGINYGYGYGGHGYVGGAWHGNTFFYNSAVSHVDVHVGHVYSQPVAEEPHVSRVSFNGGAGGIDAHATAEEESYAHERHVDATSKQLAHEHTASGNPGQHFKTNNGRPDVAATSHPNKFTGNGAVRMDAKKGDYNDRSAQPRAPRQNHAGNKHPGGHPPRGHHH